ncbi:glycosyltransferase family 2 protein [Pilimelia terevasa]|nr:glycosyltransferase [Pilimelia terevasa]
MEVLSALSLALLGILVVGFVYGLVKPDGQRRVRRRLHDYAPVSHDEVAVLIACHNGEATIARAVAAAVANGVPVYVVSDASTDDTVARAEAAGATVFAQPVNVGKPAALHAAYAHFALGTRYRAVAILDDDVVVAPDFVVQSRALMSAEVAIVVGHNVTWWPSERRWNPWLAARAYSYWNYQLVIRRLQSAANVMNCISGSNSLYRTELLDRILPERPPYIVDDTYWVLETHRRELGRVRYAPRATALLQDPTTFADWYSQNLRWMWGTFQGVIGHRVGRRATRFDLAYVLLMLHWLVYVVSGPATVWIILAAGGLTPTGALVLVAGHGVWMCCASVHLRRPRLVLFIPALAVIDLIYRVVLVHALVKAIRQPVVERCVWKSPARLVT